MIFSGDPQSSCRHFSPRNALVGLVRWVRIVSNKRYQVGDVVRVSDLDPLGLTSEQRLQGESVEMLTSFLGRVSAYLDRIDAVSDETIVYCASWCDGHRLGDIG